MHLRRHQQWKAWVVLAVLAGLLAAPASARIINASAGGHVDFSSGFPPANAAPGFVTTGIQRILFGPGGGLFLQRWHLSPQGYAEGFTGIRMFRAPLAYYFNVPTNSYLFQRRNAACLLGDPPAVLFIHFDAVFYLDGGGFPQHVAQLAYPVVGQNGPGPGSYSSFTARLMFGMRPATGAAITRFGSSTIAYRNNIPGAAFFAIPRNAFRVPAIPGGWQFLVWGDIRFETRGCPLLRAAADGLRVSSTATTAPGSDGQVGTQDDSPLPSDDTTIGDIPVPDPENVFMDMPLPEIPDGGNETFLEQSEDHDTGDVNDRPQISPIPDQKVSEGQTVSFHAAALDPNNDPLTYGLKGAPAGVSIDSAGNVTWTPGAGQSGVYQFSVTATDAHGALSETADQQVTVTVEGANHAPSFFGPELNVNEGDTLNIPLPASDPDPGQTLTFALQSPAPTGLTLSPSGLLNWTPKEDQGPRNYTLRVRVTDNGSPNLWQERDVVLHVAEVNQPPVVQPIPALSGQTGVKLSYQVVASDADTLPGPQGGASEPLTYQLQGNVPPGAAIDSATGLFTWTPAPGQAGVFQFGVMVTDVNGGVGGQQITVKVNGSPGPPPKPVPTKPLRVDPAGTW